MFLGKWNLDFQNWSKTLCLGVSGPTKWLAAQSTAYASRNWQGKQVFVKENENNEKKSKYLKSLRYMDDFFSTNDFSLLKSRHLYIIVKYKVINCCKTEADIQGCSVKEVFLKILQKSQESPCTRVSFWLR